MTPWTVARQAPLSMDFPGKNTGVGCHFLLQGSSQPGDLTCISFIADGFFTTKPPGELHSCWGGRREVVIKNAGSWPLAPKIQ